MKVGDLLKNIHPVKRTYINFAKVFGIDLKNYFVGEPFSFESQQEIKPELYYFFKENSSFFSMFNEDWHQKKTIEQISFETGLNKFEIIRLFNDDKIFMNRSKFVKLKFTDEIRYFSRYQIIELITGFKLIKRELIKSKI